MNHFENIDTDQELIKNSRRLMSTVEVLNLKLYGDEPDNKNILKDKEKEAIKSPDFFKEYFGNKGFEIREPLGIVNNKVKTLFTVSGIQLIDPVIHDEENIPDKFFVAQPVLRTQFLPTVSEGSLTSFNNISTVAVNRGYDEHVTSFKSWLEMLKERGFNEKEISVKVAKNKNRWGEKEFINEVISVLYKGVEIGEASYIDSMPQNSREPLNISDIGFGLERMNYALTGKTFNNDNENSLPVDIVDSSRTLALLIGSGVFPSNKAQGYRVRLFSKNLVSKNIVYGLNPKDLFNSSYEEWSKWINLPINNVDFLEKAMEEYDRNFNREILNVLQGAGYNIELNINQNVDDFVAQIKNSGFKDLSLLKKIYDKYKR